MEKIADIVYVELGLNSYCHSEPWGLSSIVIPWLVNSSRIVSARSYCLASRSCCLVDTSRSINGLAAKSAELTFLSSKVSPSIDPKSLSGF